LLRKLNPRERILLGVVLVGITCFVFVRFLLIPQVKAYSQVKEELAKRESELQQARALVSSLGRETRKLAEVRKEVERVEGLFRNETRDGSVVVLVGLRSATRNVEVTSLEPGEIKESKSVLELPFKITAEGSFLDILDFCYDLENLSNFSEIRSLRIESMGSSGFPGGVKANWEFVVYSRKTPEGRLSLEELARWNIGKYNIFYPAGAVAPIPELSGHLKMPPADLEKNTPAESSSEGKPEDNSSATSEPYEPYNEAAAALK